MNADTTKVEGPDVDQITHMIEVITERADQVRTKAFSLRNIAKPEVESKEEKRTGDFASEIKRRLNRIQDILDEAAESLSLFAG